MSRIPAIAIVGPGRLGAALAAAVVGARYRLEEIVYRPGADARSVRKAKMLAKRLGSRAVAFDQASFGALVTWICVADGAIAEVARLLAQRGSWKGKIVLHASGALSSQELDPLHALGASVASAHPMMTFVSGRPPLLADVPFAVEGDAAAVRVARQMVSDLHGTVLRIAKDRKPLYHAFGAFLSPLVVSELAAAERVGLAAGVPRGELRAVMAPIVAQTIANWWELGPAGAFSGPLVRGDVATVEHNLKALDVVPDARQLYVALAKAALVTLPVRSKKAMEEVLDRYAGKPAAATSA